MADQLNSSRTSSTRVRRGAWLPLALALLLALTPDLLPHASVSAQSLSPAAIGAAAVGIEAGSATSAVANPALLGLRRHGFQLVLTPISAGFSNNAFSFKDIESYFLDHWEQKENDAILALIPDQDGAWTVRADWVAGARLAAGPVGFGGSIVLNADGRVDKDILDLLLNGNELNRAYSLARSEANVVAYAETGGSLAVPIPALAELLRVKEVHLGGAYRTIFGVGYLEATAEGDGFTFVFDDQEAKLSGDGRFSVLHAQGGTGQAYDIGMAIAINDSLHVDIAVINVGEIAWRDPELAVYEVQVDTASQVAEFVEVFNGKLDKAYVAPTPQTFRIGVGGALGTRIRWAADYTRRLEGPGAGRTAFGAGVELLPTRILPFRIGVKNAVSSGLTYTAGFGLHLGPLTIDVGTPDLQSFFMEGTEWSIAVSSGIRF